MFMQFLLFYVIGKRGEERKRTHLGNVSSLRQKKILIRENALKNQSEILTLM